MRKCWARLQHAWNGLNRGQQRRYRWINGTVEEPDYVLQYVIRMCSLWDHVGSRIGPIIGPIIAPAIRPKYVHDGLIMAQWPIMVPIIGRIIIPKFGPHWIHHETISDQINSICGAIMSPF